MHFSYEITRDEYATGQTAYFSFTRPKRHLYAVFWIAVGAAFISGACRDDVSGFTTALLAFSALYWFYCGIVNFFPELFFKRAYMRSGMHGKKFHAVLDEQTIRVQGDCCTWMIQWSGVDFKVEKKRAFVLSAAGTIFIFGKKYLADEQQRELRRLAGLDKTAEP